VHTIWNCVTIYPMIEIDKTSAKQWGKITSQEGFAPRHINIDCPNNQCKQSLVNAALNWHNYGSFAYAAISCAACEESIRFFLIDPPPANNEIQIDKCRILMIPPQDVDVSFNDEIKRISPAFVTIYTQATKAELLRLDELNGIGYRKALEFLIKDYLIDLHPDKADEIKGKFLGQCIKDYITDQKILDSAERTTWLGNDETHYERRWGDHDIEDLKLLLELTIYWISSELLTRQYTERMSRK